MSENDVGITGRTCREVRTQERTVEVRLCDLRMALGVLLPWSDTLGYEPNWLYLLRNADDGRP